MQVFGFFLLLAYAWAHSNGAGTCVVAADMSTVAAMPYPQTATPGPFALAASPTTYTPGQVINITVTGPVHGIMLYGWDNSNQAKVGMWNITGLSNLQVGPPQGCANVVEALSHSAPLNLTTLSIPWTAPNPTPNLGTPAASKVSKSGFQVSATTSGGQVCYVVQNATTASPTATQVLAGQDGTGQSASVSQCQNVTSSSVTFTASGLMPKTNYSAYLAGNVNLPDVNFVWYMVASATPSAQPTIYRGVMSDANNVKITSTQKAMTSVQRVNVMTNSGVYTTPTFLLVAFLAFFSRLL
jgi:hypothetical protein